MRGARDLRGPGGTRVAHCATACPLSRGFPAAFPPAVHSHGNLTGISIRVPLRTDCFDSVIDSTTRQTTRRASVNERRHPVPAERSTIRPTPLRSGRTPPDKSGLHLVPGSRTFWYRLFRTNHNDRCVSAGPI
ncbi:hypothetical protein C7S15_5049 [Burkholderia cepacia]|nr:hypothetical protein [Burkholderia cepacia]